MVSNLTVKIGADIDGLQKELQKATGQLNGFSKRMSGIGRMIAGAFAVDQLIKFGKDVFNITAEFQKFEAVLTNTLGHRGAAQAAMSQISEFAAKTPYQVNELTSSFVKLANQGFVPTLKQMTSLGDLASAMGKSFDQLTEAIIDAQTGEFERLKEFGIRASKQGDQVTFTFKGVKTQVDFTADAIRQYVLSLGEVEGVAGGMDAQSKTLGGTLSNLQDAVDQLELSLGKLIEGDGLVSSFLNNFAEGAKTIAKWLGGPTKEELEKSLAFFKEAKNKAWMEKDMKTWQLANEAYQEASRRLEAIGEGEEKLAEIQNTKTAPAVKAATQSVKELMDQWDRQNSIFSKQFNPTDQIKKKTGADFLFDTGTLATMANAGSGFLSGLNKALQFNSNAWNVWAAGIQANTQVLAEKIEMDFAPMIQSALSGIGQALGSAINGSANLGDSLLKVLGGVLVHLGEMLLATGIGVESFKKSLSSLNGALAIGAGVALIAMGTAIAGSIKSLGSSSGSSGKSAARSGGGNSRGGLSEKGIEINIGGEWRIQGADLVYVFNRQQQLNGRTRR